MKELFIPTLRSLVRIIFKFSIVHFNFFKLKNKRDKLNQVESQKDNMWVYVKEKLSWNEQNMRISTDS